MKAKKVIKGFVFLILLIGVVAYITYVVLNMTEGNPREVCTEVSLVIQENPKASFINEQNVQELLQKAHLYPKGKLMKDIDTHDIEEVLQKNNFIEQVECYKTNNGMDVGQGKVCVQVTQRTPVIYVMPDGQDGYYIDAEGVVIPNTVYAKNIVTATGNITQEFATKELSRFGRFILDNPFWDDMIEQIYVEKDKKGESMVTLVPRIGDHTVYMGSLDKMQAKLRRLQIFYEKGFPQVGWNKYSRLNLEFDNQIVCTKK